MGRCVFGAPGWLVGAVWLTCAGVEAQERRLIAIGGGEWPSAATRRFVQWAGGTQARLLLVPWATSVPEQTVADMRAEFAKYGPAATLVAPLAPIDSQKRGQLLHQLDEATGIFFSGGDQARIMDVLDADPALLERLRARYAAGVVFGGTSAGTAVLSTPMITGDGDFTVIDAAKVAVREGLGLIPGVIFDQHFLKRQRQNRLFGLVLERPGTVGLGVDEATAVSIRDDRWLEVLGPSYVTLVDRAGPGRLDVRLLRSAEEFDLQALHSSSP